MSYKQFIYYCLSIYRSSLKALFMFVNLPILIDRTLTVDYCLTYSQLRYILVFSIHITYKANMKRFPVALCLPCSSCTVMVLVGNKQQST